VNTNACGATISSARRPVAMADSRSDLDYSRQAIQLGCMLMHAE
jgi:hypothetical protein